MADLSDAPTIYRTGMPTLGVPVFDVPPPTPEDLLGPALRLLAEHTRRLAELEAVVAELRLPRWRKVWRWLTSWRIARG